MIDPSWLIRDVVIVAIKAAEVSQLIKQHNNRKQMRGPAQSTRDAVKAAIKAAQTIQLHKMYSRFDYNSDIPIPKQIDKAEIKIPPIRYNSLIDDLWKTKTPKQMDKEAIIEMDGKRHRVTIHEAIVEKPKRWRAEKDGKYWHVSNSGRIATETETNHSVDDFQYLTRNYFQTKEEAEHELHRIKTVNKIRDRIEELNDGWWPDDSSWHIELTSDGDVSYDSCGSYVYCSRWKLIKSPEVGKTLIEEFGDDLKLLFE